MGLKKMTKQVTTPILLKKQSKRYKLLYLTFSPDGSIYISYPRKKGYEIVGETDIPTPRKKQTNVTLKRKSIGFISPKISFHPGKMSIHVTGNDKKVFKSDSRILNMGEKAVLFPLCQIIFPPAIDYLDEYKHDKYFKPLEIEVNNVEASLSLSFWIHSPNNYIALKDLPEIEQLKKVSTIITSRKFVHSYLKDYTVTVFINDLGVREKTKNKSKNIITAVFNDDQPYVYEISPGFI